VLKKSFLIQLVILFLLILTIPGCKPKVAVFEFSNLVVEPAQFVSGSSTNISIDVVNSGNKEDICPISLSVDGTPVDSQSITLKPTASQTVKFTLSSDQPGEHTIVAGNLTPITTTTTSNPKTTTIPIISRLEQTIRVLKPAEFTLANMTLSAAKIEPGKDVSVSLDVSNIGEIAGDYVVTIKMDGVDLDSKNLSLEGGATKTVDFTLTSQKPGSHDVGSGDLTESFNVLKPAEFTTSKLTLSPSTVTAGWGSTVTIDVANIGEIKGDYELTLKINDSSIETKKVTLDGGASDTVSFNLVKDEGGTYNIAVNDLKDVLTVKEGVLPVLHIGDNWVYRINNEGSVYTKTETVTGTEVLNGKDCYVVKVTYDPKYGGYFSEITEWWDKSNLTSVLWQAQVETSVGTLSETITSTYSYTGNQWPLIVGNQFTLSETNKSVLEGSGERYTDQDSYTYTVQIEKIETITVNAGSFRCYKSISIQNGREISESWYSDKAKASIKISSSDNSTSVELLSYSVKGD